MKTLFFDTASDELLTDLISREAVLWVTSYPEKNIQLSHAIAKLIELPWRAVLVEKSPVELIADIDTLAGDTSWVPVRGYLHVVASDPSTLTLPRRSQPVYLLTGKPNAIDPGESASLPPRTALRRRFNMVAHMALVQPKRIFIVGPSPLDAVDDIVELWGQGCRALITVICGDRSQDDAVRQRLTPAIGLSTVVWIGIEEVSFIEQVLNRTSALLLTEDLHIRFKLPTGKSFEVNLREAELPERPLSDYCDFIPVRDLFPLSPEDLTDEEVRNFFTRGKLSWRPFAAGLPWLPEQSAVKTAIKCLDDLLCGTSDEGPALLTVYSESGAGGTTLAREIAFAAAQKGFIPILVKPHTMVPSALELAGFMYRSLDGIGKASGLTGIPEHQDEPAWLVVLDVEHFDRQDGDLLRLFTDLVRSGRKFAVLKVMDPGRVIEFPREIREIELANIVHDVDHDVVKDLGQHLNRFLKPHGRDKIIDSWLAFWRQHRPDVDTGLASFWIALEFWLAGYLDLGESIQQWLLNQFKDATVSREIKQALLEIAALSVERRAMPESLLSKLTIPNCPWQQALDDLRSSAPALGLIRVRVPDLGSVWAIGHDVLARYLINGVHRDILFCKSLDLPESTDSVGFRLARIKAICSRPSIKDISVRPLVLSLATSVLKLDEQSGSAEFFPYWRQVLAILDGIPSAVREESRAFNHHLAISRRRICQSDFFGATLSEQLDLLEKAEKEVLFSLQRISASTADESDLNLYNTLALIYLDLASYERKTTNRREVLIALLAKSDDATQSALRENPSNSYVLETAARNLLKRAPDLDDVQRIRAAAEALSYIQQAFSLDSAMLRRQKLGKLAEEAVSYLHSPDAATQIDRLCAQGSSFGYMAKAWLVIASSSEGQQLSDAMENLQPRIAKEALSVLENATQKEWPLVRFMYELQVASQPHSFERQLLLLEELSSFAGYKISLQQQLERAVLLHQRGRHQDGNKAFASIRREAKAAGSLLFLPTRLRWLYAPDGLTKLICNAQFIDHGVGRASAQVRELAGAQVPLRPQEFGKERLAPGERFRCFVSFGAMGPFLKPTDSGTK